MIIDRFIKTDEKKLFISDSVTIVGAEPKAKEFILKAARKGGEIKKIEFVYDIPSYITENLDFDLSEGDSFVIKTGEETMVYASDFRSALYAAASLGVNAEKAVGEGIIAASAKKDFRMIKTYLPSEENIGFFKEFIDTCICLGFNTVMLETGGAMEYKKHPEINEAWLSYSKKASDNLNGRGEEKSFPFKDEDTFFLKNSIHCENADHGVLKREALCDLLEYLKSLHFEVIPELPTLSHCDYLLAAYPQFAERKDDLYPDTYCPSEKKVYGVLFDLIDEIVEVFKPKRFNIGHDEFYSFGLCEKCRKKTAEEIYSSDIIKLHDYLASKGIKTMMWSDKLINCIDKQNNAWGGAYREVRHPKTGKIVQKVPATYKAIDMIPTDIELLHWYWSMDENTENDFQNRGFKTILANFEPRRAHNMAERVEKNNGVGISNWSKVDFAHFQRNGIYMDMALSAIALWTDSYNLRTADENLLYAANELFRLRLFGAKHAALITHAVTKDIAFSFCLDGVEADENENYAGRYIIEFEDGTTEEKNAYMWQTIGFSGASRSLPESDWCLSFEPDRRLTEPLYACDTVFDGDKTYYKYAVITDKKPVSIRFEPDKKFEGFTKTLDTKVF